MSKKRLNILFLFSDQHNPSRLGCYGDVETQTPHLDALASEGTLFENCYCQNPLCVPSRRSLSTGKYSKNIGVYENIDVLDDRIHKTLARRLSESGYRTCVIGKQHINGEQYLGFQQRPYGDIYGQGHQPDPYLGHSPRQGQTGLGDTRDGEYLKLAGPTGIPEFQITENIISYEAVKYLQVHKSMHEEQPFFLMVNFPKPHWPHNPPQEFFDLYDGKVHIPETDSEFMEQSVEHVKRAREAFGVALCTKKEQDRALAAYLGCITYVDKLIGSILDSLNHLGLREDTMVVYASDHGEMAGQHALWQKGTFFRNSVNVPLIISYPEKVRKNERVETPVGLLDLYPTFLELAGAAENADGLELDGQSLSPLLTGEGEFPKRQIFSETCWGYVGGAGCMLREGDYKYNYYTESRDELYDLAGDPAEVVNLIDSPDHTEIATRMKMAVIDFFDPDSLPERRMKQPRYGASKMHYEFANQYMLGEGTIVDARP